MKQWVVCICARRAGAIGTLYTEARRYVVAGNNIEAAQHAARVRAYCEDLEHVLCVRTWEIC